MRKYAQKQHARKAKEVPETEAADVRDEDLAEQTDELLEEIACCLAEAVVTDEEKDLKAQAKAEWEANEAGRGTISWDDYWHNRAVWVEKYRDVVTMKHDCCGGYRPVWDES